MIRAQILLRDRQYELLKARARREGRSLSDVVREAVETMLSGKRPARKRAGVRDLFGLYSDPDGAGVAIHHDKHLYGKA